MNIICGFPGIGKSTVFGKKELYTPNILDSDSSTFDKEFFPRNYLQHLQVETRKGNLILASSHDVVRQALVDAVMPFHLVYPHRSLKMEYLNRYAERGSPSSFCDMMYMKWAEFIDSCENQIGCTRTVLQAGQFLNDCPEMIKLLRPA